jgi:predicted RNase H-like HicB family nuclease
MRCSTLGVGNDGSAIGTTPEEALRELQIAKAAWLDAARAAGKPIPPARYRSVVYQQAS